jgi:hypothetical protein
MTTSAPSLQAVHSSVAPEASGSRAAPALLSPPTVLPIGISASNLVQVRRLCLLPHDGMSSSLEQGLKFSFLECGAVWCSARRARINAWRL